MSALLALLLTTPPALAQVLVNGAPPAVPQPSTPQETTQAVSGRGWSVSSGPIAVPASATSNMAMSAVLVNPAGSGCTAVVTLRRFGNTSASILSFTTYKGAVTAVSGSTTVSAGNRLGGGAANSGLQLSYGTSASGFSTGTSGVSNPLYASQDKEIYVVEVLPPGTSLGVQISGLSGLLTSAVTVAVTFAGYCQ